MDSFGGLPAPNPVVPVPSNSVFASLHRRSRTADSPSSVTKTIETRDAAAREAKRFLLQVVRNDWAYPPPPTPAAAAAAEPQTPRAAVGAPVEDPEEPREIAWRHREMDNSGSEWEDGLDGPEGLDPYRFESPEAVARGLSDRRRKRRKIQEDEMKWNEGLSLWTARRDAWTGAKAPERSADVAASGAKVNLEAYRQSISSEESYNGSYDTDLVDTESQYTLSRPASNASATAQVKPSEPPADNAPTRDNVGQLTVSLDTKAALDCQAAATADTKEREDDDDECLVPIMGPLIPDSNMLRAAITPNVYPAIYSRLVIQSNTPAVPINLSHMTRALVQGWKTNGEWPPKPTPTKDVPVIKRPKQPAVNTGLSANANANEHGEMRDGKGRRLSGVSNAVKKVLGLSSFNSGNRLHLRSNSHSGSVSRPPTEDSLNAP
ncbi:hypothetical protein H112_05795 [Trichophyton rubrum D6]|nr:hypothetical protein H100_05812 [Trichophyton rubrum MR850]EZF40229.1 hypothetical protein H102_05781 [Trichophyton rubrum CBS 100081]EZF51002.1 hypothetical protein H103_05807 [Trichophyton rubrum CBS 288.86]EZF61426.1 hypothetical protein H104_05792 [Trichophyton rubrum CBS 289.86]EZF72107.1 hypothetical protein H105_05821 [Trichophyton soudanense CBS 452.61]EZF82749.1 hypothetical protein H110_05800 [Trichophyton rubrum MR1448]EZF93690.1 hypothetical protein H113_05849 [Trichophyton rub